MRRQPLLQLQGKVGLLEFLILAGAIVVWIATFILKIIARALERMIAYTKGERSVAERDNSEEDR